MHQRYSRTSSVSGYATEYESISSSFSSTCIQVISLLSCPILQHVSSFQHLTEQDCISISYNWTIIPFHWPTVCTWLHYSCRTSIPKFQNMILFWATNLINSKKKIVLIYIATWHFVFSSNRVNLLHYLSFSRCLFFCWSGALTNFRSSSGMKASCEHRRTNNVIPSALVTLIAQH